MKLKRYTKFATVWMVAVIAAVPALAQNSRIYRDGDSWVEEITGTLAQSRNLKVSTDVGSVQVQGGSDNEVRYTIRKRCYSSTEETARRTFQMFGVTAVKRGDFAIFEGSWEGSRARKFDAQFTIAVPRDMQLVKLNSDGGSINVRGIGGKLEAETGGGSVNLDDIGGMATAETGGGSIQVGNTMGELKLTTGGGSIKVVSASGRVVASSGGGSVWVGKASAVAVDTGGGSVSVGACQGETHVETGGGMIDLGNINGPVSLETGGGTIKLAGASGPVRVSTGGGNLELHRLAQGARAQTGAGSITAEFIGTPPNSQTNSVLETSAGDVTVYVAPDVKMTIRAVIQTAFGHEIKSDFSELKVSSEGGEWGPKTKYAEGNLNGGGPLLKVRTTIGNIYIRKANK
jgi:DUF4097 and DUF4098 domain-containing protein YvlB